jgi:WD40-like Beta Propeller Repeat
MRELGVERRADRKRFGQRAGLILLAAALTLSASLTGSALAIQNETLLVSRTPGFLGAKANSTGVPPIGGSSISADGRFVAFESTATNLHPDDTENNLDVFVRDLQTNKTTLVSRATGAAGAKGNQASLAASISADGRFVAFHSAATNLDPDDTDISGDVFVRDLQANTTTLVSRAGGTVGAKGNSDSVFPSISGDGRFVAFRSEASNLHPDDTDGLADVFVRDLQANTTTLASRATGPAGAKGNNGSLEPSISADGHSVAFFSGATNLHPDDTDFNGDVYVRDLQTNTTTLASRATGAGGAKGSTDSDSPSISADGRFVAFRSDADNLHPHDSDSTTDIFVRDVQLNQTTLASRADGTGGQKGNAGSDAPSISADGRLVAFESNANNLHPDDSDFQRDVFVRDLGGPPAPTGKQGGGSGCGSETCPPKPKPTPTTTLASRATGAAGAKGNSDSVFPSISGDGHSVAFESLATNLHPQDPDASWDVFVRGLQTNTTTLVDRASDTAPGKGNDHSFNPAISALARYVAFSSRASNFHPDDIDGNSDVFLRDLQANTMTLVSRATGAGGTKGNGDSGSLGTGLPGGVSISADGRFVAFESAATNLHPDDSDTARDVFVRDLQANTTTLVSRATGTAGAKGNGESTRPSISADGRFVAFDSGATNLHPGTHSFGNIFVRDLQTNTTTLVSRATGAGTPGSGVSLHPSISADGHSVAYWSNSTNLHPDDTDITTDVFVRDLQTNTTTLASRATGAAGVKGNDHSTFSSISADGRFVAFQSQGANLHPDDTDTAGDIFVRDLQASTTTLVSRAAGTAGAKGNGHSVFPSISADGHSVAFDSVATNLHPDDTDITGDVFVRDLQANTALASRATGAAGVKGNQPSVLSSISAVGNFVAFHSQATNLHPGDTDQILDVFVRDVTPPPPPG